MEAIARPAAEALSISDLIRLARTGQIRIPHFQRGFRWEGRDIERLFDSVWHGYPIGSMLFWEQPAPAEEVRLGPLEINAPAVETAYLVVDGQQRLTSLVGVLAGPEHPRRPYDLYFDLDNRSIRRPGNRQPPETWLPLRKVIDTNELVRWLLDFRAAGGSEEAVELANTVGNAIRDYSVTVSIVRTNDETVLRDIFDRLNSFGRSLTKAEVFGSLHAATGDAEPSDLRALADEVATLGFGALRDDTVLRSVLAIRGGDVFRDFRSEFAIGEDPADVYRATERALRLAIDFLQRDAYVPHVRVLPYVFVLPVLARFFHLHPTPHSRTRMLLRRWVWRGAAAGAGGGSGATAVFRRAVQTVDPNEHESIKRLLKTVDVHALPPLDLSAIQLNRAAARANVALLASLEPRDLSSGQPIDVPALLDVENGRLLRLPDQKGAVGVLSQIFVHPPLRDDELPAFLAGADADTRRSHGISDVALNFLRQENTSLFLQERGGELMRTLIARRESLAEPGASDRPAIESLIVDGADEPN